MLNIKQNVQRTIPTFKFLLFILIIFYFGFVKGLIISYMISLTYDFLMLKIFKLEPFSMNDMLFVWNDEKDEFNLIGMYILENLEIEKLKELIIERGIKKFKKLRSIHEYKFFDWWWKEIPLEDCLYGNKYRPFEILENTEQIFNTKDDIINFSKELLKEKLNCKNELPYRFTIVKNEIGEIKNFFMIKFDHSLMDGMSSVSLLAALSDTQFSPNLFPGVGIKKNVMILQRIAMILMLPYYFLYSIYKTYIGVSSGETLFKEGRKIGHSDLTVSETYDFQFFSKITKSLNITFNDLMMSVYSAAIKKYCKEKSTNIPQRVAIIIPIGIKSFPDHKDKVVLNNTTTGLPCELKLIDNIPTECKIIKKEFLNNIRNPMKVKVQNWIISIMFKICPHYFSIWVCKFTSSLMDLTLSNVPGPREYLTFGGYKLLAIIPLLTPGLMKIFVGTMSYAGKFVMTLAIDDCLNISAKEFMNYVENELEELRINYDNFKYE